jgi:hypothetical protein
VGNGFATMSTNINCSHTLGIAVPATIVVIPYAAIITRKIILEIGKRAKSVAQILKPKCMFTLGQTNTILKSWRIRPNTSPLAAQNARR